MLGSLRDLTDLLNITEQYSFNKPRRRRIRTKDLSYLLITSNYRYKVIALSKKNGSERIISKPDPHLKRIQRVLSKLFLIVFKDSAHYSSNGFLNDRNICRNAIPHIGKRYIYNIDIEDFFPSINFRRIKTVLELSPFSLTGEKEELAFLIANLVTYHGKLPQGAPTSPIISNMVCQRLDRKLTKLATENRIKYSRYADDITFSSNKNIFDQEFNNKLVRIIEGEENFNLNNAKTRLRSFMDRQIVTGLIVNTKLNVKREYIRKTRSMIYNWEKKGLEFAQSRFNQFNSKKDIKYDMRNSLRGHIDFIGLVRGKEDSVYIRMKTKYEYLYNKMDFAYIENEQVRKALIKDNRKMEMILVDNLHDDDDRFISFCTSAFHQIENLLNFYYWKKFPNIDDFKQYMLDNNPAFKKRWKTFDKLMKFKKIRDFDINLLVYLFEKEHYYDKGIFYNRELTKLREIRNDDSHRCSIDTMDVERVRADYEIRKIKWEKFREKHNRFPQKPTNEQKVEEQIKLLEFLDEKDYRNVRSILKGVIKKITVANIL